MFFKNENIKIIKRKRKKGEKCLLEEMWQQCLLKSNTFIA